ncbi:MAG TPA: NrfD/PsrC family molybdoenzyme membrane anchor subunit [Candidatus Limnocylindria bacterium]|nr:NrfD/PsrC family molybdoenzyme membrane anchor subunit [Candidatus Limnocylindria bacterium]
MAKAATASASGIPAAASKHDTAHGHAPVPAVKVYDTPAELEREPLVLHGRSLGWITNKIAGICENPMPKWWLPAFAISVGVMTMMFALITYLISTGVGVWGLNQPVDWAWDITNFVFWIGIGHAGTLISAVLFLLRQKWRTSINRAAEAMTLFAVACAGIFPVVHVGRIWLAPIFLAPIPNSNNIWPQFRSPLLWDVFAVSTYGTVSLLFWYTGLIPDLATLRDRAKNKIRKFFYSVFSLGWVGSNRHWSNYEKAYLILAGLSTPLVLSVHSIVSFDFAVSQVPGWHTTIFPPYFVAGAIFSGFGMVLTLMIPMRALFHLEDIITTRHIELMCKVILATGSIVGYAYGMEFFISWYGGSPYELWVFLRNRGADPYIISKIFHVPPAPYWWAYWSMITCNVISPHLFWSKKLRTNALFVWFVSIVVNIGMWFERFVIIVTSLHRDYLPSSWGYFTPSWVDVFTFVGSFGLFMTLFLLFIRFLPAIAIGEVKAVTPQADPHHPLGGAKDHH